MNGRSGCSLMLHSIPQNSLLVHLITAELHTAFQPVGSQSKDYFFSLSCPLLELIKLRLVVCRYDLTVDRHLMKKFLIGLETGKIKGKDPKKAKKGLGRTPEIKAIGINLDIIYGPTKSSSSKRIRTHGDATVAEEPPHKCTYKKNRTSADSDLMKDFDSTFQPPHQLCHHSSISSLAASLDSTNDFIPQACPTDSEVDLPPSSDSETMWHSDGVDFDHEVDTQAQLASNSDDEEICGAIPPHHK